MSVNCLLFVILVRGLCSDIKFWNGSWPTSLMFFIRWYASESTSEFNHGFDSVDEIVFWTTRSAPVVCCEWKVRWFGCRYLWRCYNSRRWILMCFSFRFYVIWVRSLFEIPLFVQWPTTYFLSFFWFDWVSTASATAVKSCQITGPLTVKGMADAATI